MVPLPPGELRRGGSCFDTDAKFLEGGKRDARFLVDRLDVSPASRILDFGCGVGRLPIGLVATLGAPQSYLGVDVDAAAIRWADRHLTTVFPGMRFTCSGSSNPRYNAAGGQQARLPVDEGSIDVVYAYSVFSHMTTADVGFYLAEFARALAPDGRAFFTAFVEPGVEPETENPSGYGPMEWSGPLHCVRYERDYFRGLITGAGLSVLVEGPPSETDGQRFFIARLK